jgi:coenzyme PQQ precursor peptide PqqA
LTSGCAADSIWTVETGWVDPSAEVTAMIWEAPDFVEVKMDAEINSYQDDFDREPDDRF